MNHEKTLALFSKGLAQIAERLSQVHTKWQLYRTPQMYQATEMLYSIIIEFLTRAYTWLKASRLNRLVRSITNPPELEYDDLLQQIHNCTHSIDQLAQTGLEMESRKTFETVKDIHERLIALSSKQDIADNTLRDLVSSMSSALRKISQFNPLLTSGKTFKPCIQVR